jgi:hypothetical protein
MLIGGGPSREHGIDPPRGYPRLACTKYEQSVRTSTFFGRADAVHHGLILEYEKPKTLATNKSDSAAVQASEKLINQTVRGLWDDCPLNALSQV